MKVRPFLLSWFAYVLITFVLGFIWHLVLFADVYRRLAIYSRLDDPIIPLGLTAMIVQGAVLAFAYPFFAAGATPARAGVRFGTVIALLFISIAVIAEAAKQRVTSLPTWFLLETAYYLVQFALVVPPIAAIYARAGLRSASANHLGERVGSKSGSK